MCDVVLAMHLVPRVCDRGRVQSDGITAVSYGPGFGLYSVVGLLALVLGFLNPTATPYTTTMPSENPTALVIRERHLGAGIGLNLECKPRLPPNTLSYTQRVPYTSKNMNTVADVRYDSQERHRTQHSRNYCHMVSAV